MRRKLHCSAHCRTQARKAGRTWYKLEQPSCSHQAHGSTSKVDYAAMILVVEAVGVVVGKHGAVWYRSCSHGVLKDLRDEQGEDLELLVKK